MPNAIVAIIVFPIGVVVGFALGLYSTDFAKELMAAAAANAAASEVPADVARPTSLTRARFQLKYPGNWQLDSDAEHFDLDRYFSIDTPGFSYVLFDVMPVNTSPQGNVDDAVDYFDKLMPISDRTSFDTWGAYSGVGVEIEGKYLSDACRVRIFSHASSDVSFTVTEYINSATEGQVQPGFELVEASFKLSPPAPEE